MKIGLDIGSTTLKCVVLDDNNKIQYQSYERHFSQIKEKVTGLLLRIKEQFPRQEKIALAISGSAGLGIATDLKIPFIQEVYATQVAVKKLIPETDVVIELGGEDAKILFLSDTLEVRMNGSCAGGTGAFIDQMATLLNISVEEFNMYAQGHQKIYTIASRCGVFAKSDIQPLLNQGAQKSDIAASIFYAVVNQTIGGLAQGREIKGNVVYLGGSLTFFSELRKAFDDTLKAQGVFPENSLYFVALGTAFCNTEEPVVLQDMIDCIKNYIPLTQYTGSAPLFENKEAYAIFQQRHQQNAVQHREVNHFTEEAFIGIDAGSTTIKAVVIDKDENIIESTYLPNSGNPVPIIRQFLMGLYKKHPNIQIKSSAVTGYGEDIIKNAFGVDFGIVETVAHFTAAKKFMPAVDFIIDIGGQDIKCFKIRNNAIDNIFLNEACSSGCGSFLQTFAGAIGYSVQEFAELGLFADCPVELGSRCTVFMNSSVKQAQKDGASTGNISAGLSISVVKNALYKVIRAVSAQSIGEHIVVQGGTFLNDAVLRAFEQEIKREVVRPSIAGLMGAYGAALYARKQVIAKSSIIDHAGLVAFTHEVKAVNCKLCQNQCLLTVNTFRNAGKYISGNRCERPIKNSEEKIELNLYEYKRKLLETYQPIKGLRGTIGVPLALNMYELLPFWHTFFTQLGFEVVTSPQSNRELYLDGQHTIPSDTVCFPAKLVHGHIEALIDMGINTIFYPCMTYNLNENLGDNHYNCPVVAYYPEVIQANVGRVNKDRGIKFIYDYLGLHRKKDFTVKIYDVLCKYFHGITKKEVLKATELAFVAHDQYLEKLKNKGTDLIAEATNRKMPIIILAGRPYHIDPEVSHGLDKLICQFGAAVISEDGLPFETKKLSVSVLNQWTYHSRLYAAADYIKDKPNMNLVQLVSFGCGVDAITTDEMRKILESVHKIYTQIKIDEITNLGAVKIRLRSLFATID